MNCLCLLMGNCRCSGLAPMSVSHVLFMLTDGQLQVLWPCTNVGVSCGLILFAHDLVSCFMIWAINFNSF